MEWNPDLHGDVAEQIASRWRRERPDVDFHGTLPLLRMSRICAMAEGDREREARRFGISAGDTDALLTLRRSGEPYALRPSELMHLCVVTSGAVTGRIDRLLAAGLVERIATPDDGRGTAVRLTVRGLKVADRLVDVFNVQSRVAKAFASLPPEKLQALNGLLSEVQLQAERSLTATRATRTGGRAKNKARARAAA